MMIHQMGMHEQSKYMWNILKSVLQEGEATPDLGGTLAADEFTLKYISKL